MGSWLLYGLGTENQNLPGYVVLRPSPKIVVGPALWSNSFLPAEYQATSVITSDMQVDKLVANIRNPNLTLAQQREQLDLLQQLNRLHLQSAGLAMPNWTGRSRRWKRRFSMQRQAMQTFDISREPEHVREHVRRHDLRALLPARPAPGRGRRPVRHGLLREQRQPAVGHPQQSRCERHRKLCADSDQATAALITDLKAARLARRYARHLGRRIRPHSLRRNCETRKRTNQPAATIITPRSPCSLAGGGVKGGYVYGATDEFGMNAVEDPVHVHDFHATILHLLGLDHERLTYRYAGRDFRLTDVHGHVVKEILA